MATNDYNHKITVIMGAKEYTIDPEKIPYFKSWSNFETKLGRDKTNNTHGEIENFEIALRCIEEGYRNSFRLLGTDIRKYEGLCDTLDFLLIDVLGGRTLEDVAGDLRSVKWPVYDNAEGYSSSRQSITSKKLAKDSAFRLFYMLHMKDFDDIDSSKMFETVHYIVSHRRSFKHNVRSVILQAYSERFSLTAKQQARLDEWPVYVDERPLDNDEGTSTTESEGPVDN